MSDLPPIPDPHTPPAPKNEPIWWSDLALVGLFYVVGVTVLYLLSGLVLYLLSGLVLYGNMPTIFAEQSGIFLATNFAQMRFAARISALNESTGTSPVALPIKLTFAISITLAILCVIQGLLFQSLWRWMTFPREPIPNSHYFVLLFYTAFAFLWPFYTTQVLPNLQRKKQQTPKP